MGKNYHVGTSGWSYQHWKGVFYPEEIKPKDFLEFYASEFDCVELNMSFYRLPGPKVVEAWMNRTPEYFYFCPKLSRSITHVKKLEDAEDLLKAFFSRFKLMKGKKLGPVLVQLPPTLRFGSDVLPFLELIGHHYHSYRFAIEARHKSWMDQDAISTLSELGISWVICDSNRYPSLKVATTDCVYFRFHGPKELYASKYTQKQLVPYAKMARDWMDEGKEIWAFFNNDFLGFAIDNAELFEELLK